MRLPRCKRNRLFDAAIACLAVVVVLWAIGLLDHLLEKPFSEFRWPPYIDVRLEVALELNGSSPMHLYENDWAYFRAKTLPHCEEDNSESISTRNFILIAVKSAAQNFANRAAIRSTWGAVKRQSGYSLRTIFLVGDLHSEHKNKMGDVLVREADQYGDLLIGDYIDAYRNNTLKFLSAVQLSFSYCSTEENTVPFALLVDDDYFVSIRSLVAEVKRHRSTQRIYMGWRFDSGPFRLRFHKHRVSLDAYPFDRFPPYISAGAVLISRAAIREFYYGIQHVRLFNYDDIYTGIVAYLLAMPPLHNPQMRFWPSAITKQDLSHLICAHGFTSKQLIDFYDIIVKQGLN